MKIFGTKGIENFVVIQNWMKNSTTTETLKKGGFPNRLIKNQIEKLIRQENTNAPLQT